MIPDEPDQIGEVRGSSPVSNELKHGLVIHPVHIESQSPDCNSDHTLRVIEKLDGLRVKGEVIGVLGRGRRMGLD